MELVSVLKDGHIIRTPIRLEYAESENFDLNIFTSINKNNKIFDVMITFEMVAQFKFVGVYFPEFFYNKYTITDDEDSGFFQILNFDFFGHTLLGEKSKSYLIYGYDCHLVIECCDYKITYPEIL